DKSSWYIASKTCEDGSNRISKVSDDESILTDMKHANEICPDKKSAVYVGFLYNRSSEKWIRTESHNKIKKTIVMERWYRAVSLFSKDRTTGAARRRALKYDRAFKLYSFILQHLTYIATMHLGVSQISFDEESISKAFVRCSYILNGKLFAVDCDNVKSKVQYVLCERRQHRCGYFDNVVRDCRSRSRSNLKFKCKAIKTTVKKNCRADFSKLRFICPIDNSTKADCFTFLQQGARTWALVALGVVGLAILAMGSMACCFVFSAFSGLKNVKAALPGLEGTDAVQFKKSVEILKPLTNDV
uniref:Uncharacterized protein n=1 Tax=Romanomermis culicivorax TaxID=13658 RepID=A0A915I6U6_ROMCU